VKISGTPKSVLGVDIGSHSIKLVEVKHTKEGPMITFAQSATIPQVEGDELAHMEAIRDTLNTLVTESKIQKKKVVIAVPAALEEEVTMKSIFIPDLPIDVPKEVMKMNVRAEFEAQDFISYLDDAEIDCHVEGETTFDGNHGLDVFAVAVHRDLIERRVQLLRDCGMFPIAIDVDFLALARLVITTTQLSDEEDIAILDIGATTTDVGFYQHGKLYPYPPIPFAGMDLTSHVAQTLNVSEDEAEAYKHGKEAMVDGSPEEADVWGVLEDKLNQELCLQLYGHFDAYTREFPEFKPSKVIISGGTAQLPQLDEFFTSQLAIPVDVLHYVDRIAVDANGEVAALKDNEPLFSTAVGLALKGGL